MINASLVEKYIDDVLSKVINKSAHSMISDELKDHIYCHIEKYLDEGMDMEMAIYTGIQVMGSSREVGSYLNKVHRRGSFFFMAWILFSISIITYSLHKVLLGYDIFSHILMVFSAVVNIPIIIANLEVLFDKDVNVLCVLRDSLAEEENSFHKFNNIIGLYLLFDILLMFLIKDISLMIIFIKMIFLVVYGARYYSIIFTQEGIYGLNFIGFCSYKRVKKVKMDKGSICINSGGLIDNILDVFDEDAGRIHIIFSDRIHD